MDEDDFFFIMYHCIVPGAVYGWIYVLNKFQFYYILSKTSGLVSGLANLELRSGYGIFCACQATLGGCCDGVFLGRHGDDVARTGLRSAQLAPPADRCQSPQSSGALLHLVGFRVMSAVCPSVSVWSENKKNKKNAFKVFCIKLLTNFLV